MNKKKQEDELNLDNLVSIDENKVKEIFDDDYQNKFIKLFLTDREFYNDIYDIIVPKYFDNYHKMVINHTIDYIDNYGIKPDFNDLKRHVKIKEKDHFTKEHLEGLIDKINNVKTTNSRKHIYETSSLFFKKRSLATALYTMAEKWKNDDFEGMVQPLQDALRAGEKQQAILKYFDQLEETLEEEVRYPVPALPGIDELIGGGLAGGELGVAMAPTGGGKSMFLVAVAANALLHKKKVLYFSLELDKNSIGRRFNSYYTGFDLNNQHDFPHSIIESLYNRFDYEDESELVIEDFKGKNPTLNSIKNSIERLERDESFVPDVIIIDYIDLLDFPMYNNDYRLSLQLLYRHARNMGGEFNIPIWTATQCNRSAAKYEYITIDTIAESYAKAAETDLIIGIGRGETEEKNDDGSPVTLKSKNEATFGFLKNRMGPDDIYKRAYFNTENVNIYVQQGKEKKIDNEESRQTIERQLESDNIKNDISAILNQHEN